MLPDAVAVAEAVDDRYAMGAIDDQRPLQTSPSGIVREMFPVLPVMPSARAFKIGSGTTFDMGPWTGNSVAVVEQPNAPKTTSRRISFLIIAFNTLHGVPN